MSSFYEMPDEFFVLDGKDLIMALLIGIIENPKNNLEDVNSLSATMGSRLTGYYHQRKQRSGYEVVYVEMNEEDFGVFGEHLKSKLKKAYDIAVSAQERFGDPAHNNDQKYSDSDNLEI
jgi:hypothetical protein